MGTLRPALRPSHLATSMCFVVAAAIALFAGPQTSSSASSETVRMPSPTAVAEAWVADLAAYADRLDHTLVVFGDSITARFNDVTGDGLQGYWSMLGDDLGAEPEVYAEGGAGFVNPGLVGCVGHTFGEQLTAPRAGSLVAAAGAVVIEGGRTDTQTCRKGGGYDLIPDQRLRRAVDAFFAGVARQRGAGDPCTFVLVPWGPSGLVANRDRVTQVVAQAARRYGFTFVDTAGLLTERTTMADGVHPTRRGSRSLADAVLDSSAARCF